MMINAEELSRVIKPNENTSYLTHNFHPYPAKFIPQIPAYFIKALTKPHQIVLDPFCGCGTTLVEAKLLSRRAIGIDSHPIGVLASRVKATKIKESEIKKVSNILKQIEHNINNYYKIETVISYNKIKHKIPEFFNRDHWFQENVLHELAIIKVVIEKSDSSPSLKDFLRLAMSAIIVLVSNQESETRYVAKNKKIQKKKTFSLFVNKTTDMLKRIYEFNKVASEKEVKVYQADTRYMDFIRKNSVDLIVTSPPYPNTYDYYLYHKQRMFWLDYEVRKVQDNEIGSRHKHSSKNEGIESYTRDMELCFRQFARILKPDGFFVIVIGDSVINEKRYSGFEITQLLIQGTSLIVQKQVAHELDNTSRLFNQAFRVKNKKEHFIILKNKKN